jgi:hypothetical protein
MTAFDRTYRILVVRQPDGGGFFDETGNAVEITQMRVTYTVEKHLNSNPNTAEVKIYNLNENTRALFDDRPLRVYLEAGYAGENRLLFVGDVRPGSGSELEGLEWVTTLKLRDGARAYAAARVNRSYSPGTPIVSVLRDAARSMNLELPREIAASPELAAQSASGETLSGFASDELTRLLAPYGYSWSIQNGKLLVLRDEQVIPGVERVIEQPPIGGMVGTPKMKFPAPTKAKKPKKSKKRPQVEFKHLLDGMLVPGLRIQLRGLVLDGAFKITNLKHIGDTHGNEWTTEVEGIPV